MDEQSFKQRTKELAVRTIRMVETLSPAGTAGIIGRQLVRSSASVGANYRAVCRAKSKADMIAKLGIVEEEADECLYWMELLIETGLMPEAKLSKLMSDMNEVVAMTVQSIKTLRTKTKSRAMSARS